jgi:hypothetical protein
VAYVPLALGPLDSSVATIISMATEQHLSQAHYLLAATYSRDSPHDHFGHSALVMTLLAVAGASAIRRFDLQRNKNSEPDGKSFIQCVSTYFPWEHVTILDDQHRDETTKHAVAAEQLYGVFRNPLLHCGGVVAKGFPRAKTCHICPGRETFEESEADIVELCGYSTLSRQVLLDMQVECSIVYTRPLYWCARKLIEAFAADPTVQADIKKHHRC